MKRANAWGIVAVSTVVALVTGLAVVAQGFDVVDAPPEPTDVWVLQSEGGQRYARVNTELSELDSVNEVTNPSNLAQTATSVLLFTDGDSSVTPIDAMNPQDIDSTAGALAQTPPETTEIQSNADFVVYRASGGSVWTQRISRDAGPLAPTNTQLTASAMSLSPDGQLALYSPDDSSVRVLDVSSGVMVGEAEALSPPPDAEHPLQLTWAAGTWALFDPTDGLLWTAGRPDSVSLGTEVGSAALLQSATTISGVVVIASSDRLSVVDLASGEATTSTPASGIVARPTQVGTTIMAAWLATGAAGGVAVDALTAVVTPLSFGGLRLESEPQPVIRSVGSRAVLNDSASGWVWNLPSGSLVSGSQDWTLLSTNPSSETDSADVANITTPRPPVAQADTFGVRAGSTVTLPVLLNDYDANGDVIVIDAATLSPPGFGSVRLVSQSQQVVMSIPAGASGRTSFDYRVSDGTTPDGLLSEPATVSVTVIPPEQNSAPAWCSDLVPDCVQPWYAPSVAPGGTIELNVIDGWLDSEGDQFFASGAEIAPGLGRVNVSPTGRLVYQHLDATVTTTEIVEITVRVSDVLGATSTRPLFITVTATPALTVTPFAQVTAAGEPMTIDISGHVTGGTRSATLASATVLNSPTARASVVSPTAFSFVSSVSGDVDVTITVTDSVQVATSTVRIVVSEAGSRPLALAPVNIFLTPGTDQVVDLFSAAANPDGRVLMLDSTTVVPNVGSTLFVDVIDASRVRVRGATGDGLPGRLGSIDVAISDGTGEAVYQASGQVVVYQLPSPANQPPIAVDDSASVRVGEQIDVDVLANDLGPTGSRIAIDPKSVRPDCAENLAFASSDVLRILAPSTAGTYRCTYTANVVGNPSLSSSAVVTINVVGPDGNKPPLAPTLLARVTPDESVDIPVPLTSLDPEGGAVWLVSVGDPSSGFAAVSASGQSLTYTSQSSASGQDSFSYTVRDARGGTTTGSVRVGILSSRPNPGPITATDYVDVTAGSNRTITIDPTANDVDTVGGGLSIEPDSVVPDAREGTDPYRAALEALESVEGNDVTVRAPAVPSTLSYRYSVVDASGNVSVGLLIVRAVIESAPTYPAVTDTYVTFADRTRLVTGVDVVTNKVSWTGGDVSGLELSLWNESGSFTASGWSILGSAPDSGAVIPFKLTGVDYNGFEVVSFGFLRIPPLEAAILTLKAGIEPVSVREEDSVTFNVADFVATPPGTSIELASEGAQVFGARPNARCDVAGGAEVTYFAGAGPPWSDGCIVSVSLRGAQTVTRLLIPVSVVPLDPEPELSDRALEISPGSPPTNTKVFDLTTMTTWIGNDDFGSLDYAVTYNGDSFDVERDGSRLTIIAKDDALPGTREDIEVRIENHPRTLPANVRLTVGPAPSEGPLGGFGTLNCDATAGSCQITVAELTGTFNPFATALTFTPFGFPDETAPNVATCGQATLTATSDAIVASWTTGNATVGATCSSIAYTVADAQGRTAPGFLSFSLAGFPGQPGAVTQSAYTETSLTLRIEPNEAGEASPPLRGYRVYQDGDATAVADCAVAGGEERFALECEINGLVAFEPHSYRAVPYNDLGESAYSSSVSNAYAYRAPLFGSIDSATGVYSSTLTTRTTGAISVTVTPAADDQVQSYVITGDGGAGLTPSGRIVRPISGDYSTFTVTVAADAGGGSGVTVAAVGVVPPPVGASGGTSSERRSVDVPGLPSLTQADTLATASGGGWQVSMTAASDANGGDAPEYLYLLWPTGVSAPECAFDAGAGLTWSAAVPGDVQAERTSNTSAVFSGLTGESGYESLYCVTNGYGLDQMRGATVGLLNDPAPGTYTFAVSATAVDGAYLADVDAGSAPAGLIAQFRDGAGAWSNVFSSNTFGNDLTVYVRYCLAGSPDTCSAGETLVTPSTPDRSWQVRVTSSSLATSCVFDAPLEIDVVGDGLGTPDSPNWRLSTDIPPIFLDATDSIFDTTWDSALAAWVIPSGSPDPVSLYATIEFINAPQIAGLDPFDAGPIPLSCSAP